MSTLTADFLFEIGDTVFFSSAQHAAGHRPKQFVIYERLAQECHGGIQRLYRLGGVDMNVPEVLLVRDEPAYRPMSQAEHDENLKVIRAKNRVSSEELWGLPIESRKSDTESE